MHILTYLLAAIHSGQSLKSGAISCSSNPIKGYEPMRIKLTKGDLSFSINPASKNQGRWTTSLVLFPLLLPTWQLSSIL